MSQKLWLIGIFRGNREILEKTILPVIDFFDGLIAVVDSKASQDSIDWLNSIKKDGEIIVKKWVNDHSHTMNETLFTGKIKFPDYCVIIDETDLVNKGFAKELRESVKYWNKNDIGCIWIDHPFVFRYHDGFRFSNSPHWGITHSLGSNINLATMKDYKKESYVFNLRDDDKLRSAFLSPIKYWFCYPNGSNQTQLLYQQFGDDIWQKHEHLRIKFRLSCQLELGLEPTIESLTKYLQENVGKYPDWFEQTLESEVNLIDAFRLFVLKQEWQVLAENRFNFSYFLWKETGKTNQGKHDGYLGLFNQYKIQKGEKLE